MDKTNENNGVYSVERFVLKSFENEYSLGKELKCSTKNIEGLPKMMYLIYLNMLKEQGKEPNNIYIISKRHGIDKIPDYYVTNEQYKERGFRVYKINDSTNIFDSTLIEKFDSYNIFEENLINPFVKSMEIYHTERKFNKMQYDLQQANKKKLAKQSFKDEFSIAMGGKLVEMEKQINSVFGEIEYPKSFDIDEFKQYFQVLLMASKTLSKELSPAFIKRIGVKKVIFKENNKNKKTQAYYLFNANTITLNIFHDTTPKPLELLRFVYHEFGHAIDYKYIQRNDNYRKSLVLHIRRLDYVQKLRLSRKENKAVDYQNHITYKLQADELLADVFSYYILAKYKQKNPLEHYVETIRYFALEFEKIK